MRAAAERQAYFGCPRCGVWDGDIAPLTPRHLFLHHPSPKIVGKDTADPRHRSISLEAGPSSAVIKCSGSVQCGTDRSRRFIGRSIGEVLPGFQDVIAGCSEGHRSEGLRVEEECGR